MATARALGGFGLLVILLAVPFQGPDGRVLRASTLPPMTLDLRLTFTQDLPAASVAALVAETTAIWQHHIRLQWLPEGTSAVNPVVRVLAIPRALPEGERDVWTVGELVRTPNGGTAAIASITSARRILDSARQSELLWRPDLFERRLGIVLGRAVAHEIGHYLLETVTHASHGLMRARIDAREFADIRSESFRLDPAARAHLARIAASGSAESFSYAP